jgi:glucosamine-6-phosphate deaminase
MQGEKFISMTVDERKTAKFENLKIEIYSSREAAGHAAAIAVADALRKVAAVRESFGVIFATGASQLPTLNALSRIDHLPWGQVHGFNVDDYVGLPADHPASFHAYLRDRLPQRAQMKSFLEVDGGAPDVDKMCRGYTEALRVADPQVCLLGIGENGHLAFNDPAEANFNDPFDVRIVHLDKVCRQQQAAEGWFKTYEDVPDLAVTLTIPALLRVPKLIISVPGKRKASVVRRTVQDPISTACPSTILRTHPDATVYLDEESAAGITDLAGRLNGSTMS